MKTYNKLVRDRIPEIIKATGKQCTISIATQEELDGLLIAKLHEEVEEFKEARNLEELADIMEVLFSLASSLGYSEAELIAARGKKHDERGGFSEGIVLHEVE